MNEFQYRAHMVAGIRSTYVVYYVMATLTVMYCIHILHIERKARVFFSYSYSFKAYTPWVIVPTVMLHQTVLNSFEAPNVRINTRVKPLWFMTFRKDSIKHKTHSMSVAVQQQTMCCAFDQPAITQLSISIWAFFMYNSLTCACRLNIVCCVCCIR